jgi:hypothetical protein
VDKVDNVDKKEYLIRELSKELGVFPLSRFDMGELPFNIVSDLSKLPIKWNHSNSSGNLETLYQHKSGFYIYTKRGLQFSDVSIFYKTEQHDEIQFFINRLLKK